jgi:glycosyltransferase involved in cell wall biosynthesis
MPYNILHVTPYMHASAGGPPVVVEGFITEASRLGHSSEIVSTFAFCHGDDDVVLRKRLEQLAPATYLTGLETVPGVSRSGTDKITAHVRRADIVHVHTLWSPLNVAARHACQKHGKPYVLMPHGMLDPYSLSVKAVKKSFYLKLFEGRNMARAQRMIYTTSEEERLATLAGLRLPRGAIVPLGAKASSTPTTDLRFQFLKSYPQAQRRRNLLFLGRLHHKKGLDRILNGLHQVRQTIPNALLIVAGAGEPKYEQHLKQLVSSLALDDHVVFTGHLDGELKWASFAAAELFLLPSRQENFAITVAEAMQMGVPVVITDKVNTWPYVEEAGAGLVLTDADIDILLPKAIETLLTDEATRSNMAARGRRYARDRLTWHASVQKLLACYDQVISG